MADNPYVNKVVYNNSTLIDLTGDTVTQESLLSGYTAHDRSGASINGTAVIPTKVSDLQNDVGYLAGTDVVNNLTSGGTTVPLSAEMGKKLGVHDLGTFSTLAALETAINNELSNLETGQQADIKFNNSTTFGLFVWTGTWVGTLQKNYNARGIIKCFMTEALPPKIIYGDYKDGTCVWNLSSATRGSITDAASTIDEMFGYYVYSPSDRMVRIYISARSTSKITTSTILGVIPSGFRPPNGADLIGVMGTGTGMAVYKGHVNPSGAIYQDIGNTLKEIFLVGEYYVY